MLGRNFGREGNGTIGEEYSEHQVRSVLDSIGLKVHSETVDHFLIFCPYHNNFRTPACEVDKEKGLFICFACSEAGALVDLVSYVADLNFFAAMRLIGSFADAAPELDMEKMLAEKENTFDQDLVARLHENIQKSDVAIEYLESRGISIRSMLDFRIGYSEARKMITIPLMNPDGEYVGFVGRSIDPNAEKRFQNFKGMDRTGSLFNLENNLNTREVFVVEASIDAIRIHQAGFPVVATLGILSKGQALLLNKYFDIVHFIPDNAKDGSGPDVTGLKTFAKAERLCSGSIDMVTLPKQFKDAGDMTDEQIKSVLSAVV